MDATENSLTDTGFDELVWLYVGCFPTYTSFIDHINILPFIDMNSRDYSCLLSVICFVNNEIRSKELPGTSLITFYQPLLVKAVEIVRAKDVSHPYECSRWLIPYYVGSGRGGSAVTSLQSKCSHAHAVWKGYISSGSCYTSTRYKLM